MDGVNWREKAHKKIKEIASRDEYILNLKVLNIKTELLKWALMIFTIVAVFCKEMFSESRLWLQKLFQKPLVAWK